MRDAQARREPVWPAFRRFWPVAVIVTIVCAWAASWAAEQAADPTYTAQAQYIVPIAPDEPAPLPGEPPPPPTTLPDDPYDASTLARTYELVLAEDNDILTAVSERLGVPVPQIAGNLDALQLPSTRVIRVTFTGESEEQVIAFFNNLTDVLENASPSPHLPTGNLVALREPTEVDPDADLSAVAPWIGGIAGLLLGIGAVILLERLDRRVRTTGDLRGLAEWPVFNLDVAGQASDAAMETVVLRVLRGAPAARRVAVMTSPHVPARVVATVTEQLAAAESRLRRSGSIARGTEPVQWSASGSLAQDGHAERGAQEADAVVVVIPRGARLRSVADGLQNLEDVDPKVVVLAVTPRARQMGSPAQGAGTGTAGAAGDTQQQPRAEADRERSAAASS